VEEIVVANYYASGFGGIVPMLYFCFMGLMMGGWIYFLFKVSEISRSTKAITEQQESQSRSLAYLAESVAVLARNSAAQKPEPPVRIEY
jgi:hypothetical protein